MTAKDFMIVIVANTILSTTITIVLMNLLGLKIIRLVFEENERNLETTLNCIKNYFKH